jgi:hypothetical protein
MPQDENQPSIAFGLDTVAAYKIQSNANTPSG